MTTRYWLLGAKADLQTSGLIAGEFFGVNLDEHDSGYRGGRYLRATTKSAQEIIVQANFEDDEGYLAEPDFPDYRTVIYVTQDGDALSPEFSADPRLSVLRVEEL